MRLKTSCAALLACASPALAADPAAKAFGAREYIQQISLSPDGRHVAMIVPAAGRAATVVIADMMNGGDLRPILQSSGNPDRLTDCHWSTDTRLVCRIYMISNASGTTLDYTRMISLDSDGGNMKLLSARTSDRTLGIMQQGGTLIDWLADGKPGSALVTRMFVPESTTGSMIAQTGQGLGVELVDTATLARRTVEQPRQGAAEYITDGHGTVRIMGTRPKLNSGYDAPRVVYSYRKPGSREWLPLSQVAVDATGASGFDPYAVDSKLNVAYGFDVNDGRRALYRVALDGSLKRELVLARPDVDVGDLVRIGRQNRVVGASYVTERRQTEFFDPELHKLGLALGKALPGQPLVTFVDASADESKLLLFAGSDTDPGRYYLYDKATRKLEEITPVRPQLRDAKLASVSAISFRAADGTPIPAYLTLPAGSTGKNIPAIVMPHGGPGARDEWGFDWLAQYFAARGFAVLQPNFRGSTGYGSAWFQKNGFQSWRTAIGDVNDAGRWLSSQGIAAPGKLAIVGWSYGGYAALQSAVLDPDLFKAIVAIAPVTDLNALREEARGYTNFVGVDAFIGKGAHVVEGSPARNAGRIKAPVLLFHGDLDRNVGVGESRLMASRLKAAGDKVDYVEFKGLDHQLDESNARATMLDKADGFLRMSLGM